MLRSSRAHLAQVGESYWEHMRFAVLVSLLATGAGFACLLHAVVPGVCEHTCSRTIGSLQVLFGDRERVGETMQSNSALLIFVVLMLISFATCFVVALCMTGSLVGLILLPQAFALPLIFLSQNPELEPVRA